MFKNYLKIAWRNLLKNKTFSAINILGLSIGLATCLLLLQYIIFEMSYDDFHLEQSDIYRLQQDKFYAAQHSQSAWSAAFVGPVLQESFPEIEAYTKLWETKHINNILAYQQEIFSQGEVYYADSSFFSIFSYPLIEGDQYSALAKPYTIVLTESIAQKLFGNENPLGKTIQYTGGWGRDNYTVTGIAKDSPENTHLKFKVLISFPTLVKQTDGSAHASGGWNAFLTYLKLKKGTHPEELVTKFPAFVEKEYAFLADQGVKVALHLQPLGDIHLKSNLSHEIETNGRESMVYFLGLIALFILILAWVNYINLSTAKAIERAKEVGIRKVAGAKRRELVIQFMLESLLINALSLSIAVMLVELARPLFGWLIEKEIAVSILDMPMILGLFIIALVAGSLLAGMYPALIMSGFSPMKALKQNKIPVKGISLRKGLVVFQFATTVALLAGTFAVYQQLDYMHQKDLGIDVEQMLVLNGPGLLDSTYAQRLNVFKNQSRQIAAIQELTNSTMIPGKEIGWINNNVKWTKRPDNEFHSLPFIGIGDNFFETFKIPILAGRSFSNNFQNEENAVLITKAAAQQLGFENIEAALNEKILDGGRTYQIIGVTANFHQQALNTDFQPIIFRNIPNASSYYSFKINTADLQGTLASLEKNWNEQFSGSPFNFFFLDTFFDQQYKADRQFGSVFGFFALLSILVACLGLFGLSSLMTTKRTKEIGVRKVLGASVSDILMLLSSDYLKLILIANVVAAPFIYYAVQAWLEGYAFRIDFSWWVMVLIPGVLVLLIAVSTVCGQAIKTAVGNPTEALRYE